MSAGRDVAEEGLPGGGTGQFGQVLDGLGLELCVADDHDVRPEVDGPIGLEADGGCGGRGAANQAEGPAAAAVSDVHRRAAHRDRVRTAARLEDLVSLTRRGEVPDVDRRLPFVTKPGPCGGTGTRTGQTCMSEMPAMEDMTALAAAAAAALIPSV